MTLAHEIARLLSAPTPLTISAAESLTSGWVQAELASVSGSSSYYYGGVTAYRLEAKVDLLKADPDEVKAQQGVSASVARQMAVGACALFGTELGLSTTGFAETSESVAVPFAFWCVAHREPGTPDVTYTEGRVECPGLSRSEVQEKITQAVLTGLRDHLRHWRKTTQGA